MKLNQKNGDSWWIFRKIFKSKEKMFLKEVKEESGLDIIELSLLMLEIQGNKGKIYYFLCTPAEGEVIIK